MNRHARIWLVSYIPERSEEKGIDSGKRGNGTEQGGSCHFSSVPMLGPPLSSDTNPMPKKMMRAKAERSPSADDFDSRRRRACVLLFFAR